MFTNAIIVLGCGIDSAGNLNPDAENSVRLASNVLQEHPGSCLIMTGSVSYKATFKPSISEAQAMKEYAVMLGIPSNIIFVETESKDTLGNFYFTKLNLLMPLDIHTMVIVRGPNQSDERIEYLATKVLGDTYSFKIVRPDINRPEEQDREEQSLAIAKEWLDPIADGDMPAIYRLMRNKHPGYNSSLSLESLKTLL
ncbi:YdcF family protein [Candidatus Saccharibacteria bacterium]|nr:YdcF family protein [Candidatus Saccharibacteria bacterium]